MTKRKPPRGMAFDTSPGRSYGYQVRDTFRSFTKALERRITRYGITMGQWYFLRELWEEEGMTQRELSSRIGLREPTTVSILRGMEKNRLVRRVRNAHDGRKVNVFLTPAGRRLREKLLPYAAEVNQQAIHGIGARELDVFRRVVKRMRENLSALHR